MHAEVLVTVILTAIVQSVLGAGVLLFGTPILLLLGYDFVDALVVLLPISIAVFSRSLIDVPFIENAVYLTIGTLIFLLTNEMLNKGLIRECYRVIFSRLLGHLRAAFACLSGQLITKVPGMGGSQPPYPRVA